MIGALIATAAVGALGLPVDAVPSTLQEWGGTALTGAGGTAAAIALYRGLASKLDSIQRDVSAIATRVEVAVVRLDSAIRDIDELGDDVRALRADSARLSERVTALESRAS